MFPAFFTLFTFTINVTRIIIYLRIQIYKKINQYHNKKGKIKKPGIKTPYQNHLWIKNGSILNETNSFSLEVIALDFWILQYFNGYKCTEKH